MRRLAFLASFVLLLSVAPLGNGPALGATASRCGSEPQHAGQRLDASAGPAAPAGGARTLSCLANSGAGAVRGDFNGDGFSDLAIGVPFEDVGPVADAGAVNVLYGSASGLTSTGNQFLTQEAFGSNSGVDPTSEAGDQFGSALAAADFDLDGFADLAIGIPGEDLLGSLSDAGAVMVLFGGAGGLAGVTKRAFITQDTVAPGNVEAGDLFGFSLTWGEFGNGTRPDLAIGVPGESLAGVFGITLQAAGEVDVLYESSSGFGGGGKQQWTQNTSNVPDQSEPNDHFGATLAGGNMDGGAQDDLAVGVADEDIGSLADAGAVHVLYGTGTGLSATGTQLWTQNTPDIEEFSESGDRFGAALTIGDFDGNAVGDLAVGVPTEDVFSLAADRVFTDAGAVNVIMGTGTGLAAAGDQFVSQENPGLGTDVGTGDQFGSSLAAGDFNADGVGDLAAGAPLEDVLSFGNTGEVEVFQGSPNGLGAAVVLVLDESDFGGVKPEERFGTSVAAWNFNGDAFTDIAIGIPFQDAGILVTDSGSVAVEYGSTAVGSLDAGTAQLWNQNTPGVLDQSEKGDEFGLDLY